MMKHENLAQLCVLLHQFRSLCLLCLEYIDETLDGLRVFAVAEGPGRGAESAAGQASCQLRRSLGSHHDVLQRLLGALRVADCSATCWLDRVLILLAVALVVDRGGRDPLLEAESVARAVISDSSAHWI